MPRRASLLSTSAAGMDLQYRIGEAGAAAFEKILSGWPHEDREARGSMLIRFANELSAASPRPFQAGASPHRGGPPNDKPERTGPTTDQNLDQKPYLLRHRGPSLDAGPGRQPAGRRGNKKLKRALFLSAFAALHHPPSRAYYDRCERAEGNRHNQAIIALARRRSDVLFAMLRDSTLYQDPTPAPLASAA